MPLAAAIGADLRVGRDAALEHDPVEPAPLRKALDVSLGPDRLLLHPLVERPAVFETEIPVLLAERDADGPEP